MKIKPFQQIGYTFIYLIGLMVVMMVLGVVLPYEWNEKWLNLWQNIALESFFIIPAFVLLYRGATARYSDSAIKTSKRLWIIGKSLNIVAAVLLLIGYGVSVYVTISFWKFHLTF